MGIFDKADTGLKNYRSHFNLKSKKVADIDIGKLVPLYADFVLPGDIWNIKDATFIRTQPMLAPLLTDLTFKMRYFFVPLRLLDENTELIITGSNNGKFDKDVVIP